MHATLLSSLVAYQKSNQSLLSIPCIYLTHQDFIYNYSKLNQISLLFDHVDILCLTETWLHDAFTDSILEITGMKLFRWDRSNGSNNGVIKCKGIGLACYVKNNIASDCMLIVEHCITTPDIELQILKLTQTSHKNRHIINLYSPPSGDIDTFFKPWKICF